MKHIKQFLLENEYTEIFRRQDEFREKMIEEWKHNKNLKVFDKYFQWKTHKINITDLSKEDVNKMRAAARDMLDKLWEDEENEENNKLAQIIDAIEMELINMLLCGKLK